jgi:hypothetical protein
MTRCIRDKLCAESGEGLITGLLLLVGVLIPLMFLVPLFARIELAQVDAQQAARDSVRSAVEAPNASAALAAATSAFAREQAGSRTPMTLSLRGTYARGQVMSTAVTARVPLGSLPVVGHFGTIVVHGEAHAPVDRYRSILESGGR